MLVLAQATSLLTALLLFSTTSAAPGAISSTFSLSRRDPMAPNPASNRPNKPQGNRRNQPITCKSPTCQEEDDLNDQPDPGDVPITIDVNISPGADAPEYKPAAPEKIKKTEKPDPPEDHDEDDEDEDVKSGLECYGEVCSDFTFPTRPGVPIKCTHMAGRVFESPYWTCCPKGLKAGIGGKCCTVIDPVGFGCLAGTVAEWKWKK